MKKPQKGRCNVTLIFDDGATVLKLELADVLKTIGHDIVSTGMRLVTEFGPTAEDGANHDGPEP